MGRALTNSTGLVVGEEPTFAADPTTWTKLEPNDITTFGPNITTVEPDPITTDRQRRAGTITDLESPVEMEADIILSHFEFFTPYFMRSIWKNGYVNYPTAVTATAYTVPSGDVLVAGDLVRGTAFGVAANNGANKEVDTGATATSIPIVGGLTVEGSPPTGALVERHGFRGATGDIEVDANGNLISTVLDFTTLAFQIGQVIHVGGQAAANRFAVTDDFGFARITAIAANLLTLDKKATTFTIDNGAGQRIDLMFTRFIRNVAVDHADYNDLSLQFEAEWSNLQDPGPGDEYEYAIGNKANSMGWNVPGQDKATYTMGFVGRDTPAPVTGRKSGASTATELLKTERLNTVSDVARLRITEIDETGMTTDFTSFTLTLLNNTNPEKVIGFLGGKYINDGTFELNLETEILFTSSAVIAAIRANTTVTMDFALRNTDGGVFIDIPNMKLGGGARGLTRNETIKVTTTGAAFRDPASSFAYSLGISHFAFLPTP